MARTLTKPGPKVCEVPLSDPRWAAWTAPVLAALMAAPRNYRELAKLRLNPKWGLPNALAYLDIEGFIFWERGKWRAAT